MNFYLILIVSSILCGLAAALMAKMKGRSPLGWFVLGAVLSVLALVIITVTSKSKFRES